MNMCYPFSHISCNDLPCSAEQLLTNELHYHEWDNAADLMREFHTLTPKQQEQLKILMDAFRIANEYYGIDNVEYLPKCASII